jgi:hypothetical protein
MLKTVELWLTFSNKSMASSVVEQVNFRPAAGTEPEHVLFIRQ